MLELASTRREFIGSLMGGLVTAGSLKEKQRSGGALFSEGRDPLRAGAATSVITPRLGVPLTGTISQKGPCEHVHDELHARCLALDNGTQRLAFAVCDGTYISKQIFDKAKALVHRYTGLPPSRVVMSATHSHSTPRSIPVKESPIAWPQSNPALLAAYEEEFLPARIADGIRRAINNLEPAEIAWGTGSVPDQVFNRRWYMESGTIPPNPLGGTDDKVLMNPPAGSPDLVKPAGPTDPEVSFLSVRATDGRPLALLANYSLHYVGGIPGDTISADYFGVFADTIRERIGAEDQDPPFVGILSNGTSGDANNINFREERTRRPPYEQMREVAEEVAAEVFRVYQDLEYVNNVTLGSRERRTELGVRLPSEEEVARARTILDKIPAGGWLDMNRKQIYARETLYMNQRPPIEERVLQAVHIGELGIVMMPSEVFAETGLKVKSRSPFSQTFTIELANDYGGYMPPPEQHALGGYETWRARSSFLEVDAEPKMLAHLFEMLDELT